MAAYNSADQLLSYKIILYACNIKSNAISLLNLTIMFGTQEGL